MRGKPLTPEGMLTLSVRQFLRAAGIFHWKVWQGMGSTPGVPDIIGIHEGKFIGIELKAPRGVISPAQRDFIERINRAGGIAFVAKTLDEVIEGLGLQDRFLLR